MRIRIAHASMQFSDTAKEKLHDANAIFHRAKELNYAWLTGTEAAEEPLHTYLLESAHDHGYTFAMYKGLWVAVRKNLIRQGTYMHEAETLIDTSLVAGAGQDTSLIWAQFVNDRIGAVTVMGGHYPRFGQPDSPDPAKRVNLQWTEKVAHAIGEYANEFGKGAALFFYGGDQNIPDNISDTFFNQPLTSAADELHSYHSTGHGQIDVIASYNGDRRVEAISFASFTDREFMLYTDHYLIEAVYDVKSIYYPS